MAKCQSQSRMAKCQREVRQMAKCQSQSRMAKCQRSETNGKMMAKCQKGETNGKMPELLLSLSLCVCDFFACAACMWLLCLLLLA